MATKQRRETRASLFVVCSFLACVLACHSDRSESFYSSLTEAKKDGAIDRGWIPGFMPESSHNIHELHDLSPSTQWCAFEFSPGDSPSLRKVLKSDGTLFSSVRRVPDPGKPWWPAALMGDLNAVKIRESGLDLYLSVEPETASTNAILLVAIDWVKGRGFFYRAPVSS